MVAGRTPTKPVLGILLALLFLPVTSPSMALDDLVAPEDETVGGDVGNTPEEAHPLKNGTYRGSVHDNFDSADYYRFDATAGEVFHLYRELAGRPWQALLVIFGPSIDEQGERSSFGVVQFIDPSTGDVGMFVAPVTGSYYVRAGEDGYGVAVGPNVDYYGPHDYKFHFQRTARTSDLVVITDADAGLVEVAGEGGKVWIQSQVWGARTDRETVGTAFSRSWTDGAQNSSLRHHNTGRGQLHVQHDGANHSGPALDEVWRTVYGPSPLSGTDSYRRIRDFDGAFRLRGLSTTDFAMIVAVVSDRPVRVAHDEVHGLDIVRWGELAKTSVNGVAAAAATETSFQRDVSRDHFGFVTDIGGTQLRSPSGQNQSVPAGIAFHDVEPGTWTIQNPTAVRTGPGTEAILWAGVTFQDLGVYPDIPCRQTQVGDVC